LWYLCKHVYNTTPDDPRIVNMDPVQKRWMYENWVADQNDEIELAKNHAYLLASFSNPEAVKKIMKGNDYESTEEEFEESTEIVRKARVKSEQQVQKPTKRTRRRKLQG
jgi:hypothetical protein